MVVAAEVSTAAGVEVSAAVAGLAAAAVEDIGEEVHSAAPTAAALLAARVLSARVAPTGAVVSPTDRPPAVTEAAEVRPEDSAHRAG
jgi:hypothetical protein